MLYKAAWPLLQITTVPPEVELLEEGQPPVVMALIFTLIIEAGAVQLIVWLEPKAQFSPAAGLVTEKSWAHMALEGQVVVTEKLSMLLVPLTLETLTL